MGGGGLVYIFIGSILFHDHILREIAGGIIVFVGIAYGLFPSSIGGLSGEPYHAMWAFADGCW